MKYVVFDFDGVIHSYKSGWKGIDVIPDEPVDGIAEVIENVRNAGMTVVVVSSRCAFEEGIQAIKDWLDKYGIVVDSVQKEKPPAIVTVDDRCICFNGETDNLTDRILKFKSWTSKQSNNSVRTARLTKEQLANCFDVAIKENAKYIGVAISVKGATPEIIINKSENFESKLNYYMKAYDDNLHLATCDSISIVGFTQGDSFDEIEQLLCF